MLSDVTIAAPRIGIEWFILTARFTKDLSRFIGASMLVAMLSSLILLYLFSPQVTLSQRPQIISSWINSVTADSQKPLLAYSDGACIEPPLENNQVLDNQGVVNLGVWNIYKLQNSGWQQVLQKTFDTNQLVLLQEAKWSDKLLELIATAKLNANMVNAFEIDKAQLGVMTLSEVQPQFACGQLQVEPIIRFPKSALISRYPLSNGQQLLVINQHSVNFELGTQAYRAQLGQIESIIAIHQGPVILAGDFNTWSDERKAILDTFAQSYGLSPVAFHYDHRTQVLGNKIDHIYYRQLQLIDSQVGDTQASDHQPLFAQFRLQ